METLRPVEVSEYYINRIASGMSKYFWDNIFKEIFDILEGNTVYNSVYNGNINSGHYNHLNIKGRRGGSLPKGANKNFVKDIEEVIAHSKSNNNSNKIIVIGPVQKMLIEDARNNNLDIRGYSHNIDVYGVKHSLNEHGNETKEELRGQIAITEDDIKQAQNIVYSYDKATFGEKNNQGRDIIKLYKQMPDGCVLYIEEIRTGRHTLTLNAMRKYKNNVGNSNTLAGMTRHVWSTDSNIITDLSKNFNPFVNNSKDDVINAIRNGSIWYENGAFRTKNRFSNAVAKTLEEMGAKFKYNAYYISKNLIPFEYAETLAYAATQAALKADLIANFLGGYLLSKTDLKEYIESFVDLMYRKLELDIFKSAQEKQIPVIELGIVQPKIKLSKAQAKKLEKYWQEQDKKAKELQKAIKQAAKRGEDTNSLKIQLADLNKNAFENAPQFEFTIDDVKLDAKSKKIAQDYTYNMQYWVKKWETKNIIKMRQDVLQMIQEGARVPRIQEYFEKRWKIAKNKAHFLAVNESHLAGAVIKATDYQMLGCNSFEWGKSSSKEKRELHKHYYGKVFTFDNKPIIDEELGIRGLPREIWNCKCRMLIVVPTLQDLLKRRTEIKNERNIFKRIQNSTQRNNNAWRYRRFGQGQTL